MLYTADVCYAYIIEYDSSRHDLHTFRAYQYLQLIKFLNEPFIYTQN